MHHANISEAKAHLSQLIKRALAGDEVIITKADQPLVKLTPLSQSFEPRTGGQWAGQVTIGDDFEFTLNEIDQLFYGPVESGKQ